MFPVKAPTTWPQSCSAEIASCVLRRSFPTCFHKICRGSTVLQRTELGIFLQQSVVRHYNENWFVIYMVSEGKMNLWNVVNEILDKVQWESSRETVIVILWNLNSRLAELGDILRLSVFCMNCNVNGNFMGLNQNENGLIAHCFKCGIV